MHGFITKKEFIELIKATSLEYGEFELSSGAKSTFYLDIKKLTLSEGMFYIAEMLDRVLVGIDFDAIGGPETGANAIVGGYLTYLGEPTPSFIPRKFNKRGFVVKKGEKDHGKKGLIVGNLQKGDKVVLVEDVTTTGQSVLKAIEVIEEIGKVVLVVSIVDRQAGATEAFSAKDIAFKPLLTLEEVLAYKK